MGPYFLVHWLKLYTISPGKCEALKALESDRQSKCLARRNQIQIANEWQGLRAWGKVLRSPTSPGVRRKGYYRRRDDGHNKRGDRDPKVRSPWQSIVPRRGGHFPGLWRFRSSRLRRLGSRAFNSCQHLQGPCAPETNPSKTMAYYAFLIK